MGSELPAFCFSSDSHRPGGDKRQEHGLFSGLGHTLGSSPTSCHAKVSFLRAVRREGAESDWQDRKAGGLPRGGADSSASASGPSGFLVTLRVTFDLQPMEGMPRPELGQVSFQDCSPEKVPHPGAGAWPCWVALDVVLGVGEPGSPQSLSLGDRLCSSLNGTLPCAAERPSPGSVPRQRQRRDRQTNCS